MYDLFLSLWSISMCRSNKPDDPHSLRLRLSKAEAAVEKERRAVQAMERQLREGESAAAEGRAATAAAFELRRRCDAAEREAAAATARASQLEAAAAALPDAHAQALHGLQLAEQRALAAEGVAKDLRVQCDAAARTISKLMEETQELTQRLNKQGDLVGELQEALAAAKGGSVQPGYNGQDFYTPQRGPAQVQYNSHDAYTPQPTLPGMNGDMGAATGNGYEAAQGPPVWQIPGAQPVAMGDGGGEVQPVEEEVSVSPRPKKKVGFWAWVAGADLVDDE